MNAQKDLRSPAARAHEPHSWGERFGLGGLRYPIPGHANTLPFTLGGLTLISFLVLVFSGIYLAFYHQAAPEGAHDSVTFIVREAPLGNIARGIHYWAANIFVVTLALHLVRVLLYGSYKRPRELNYIVGVLLFALAGVALFSGTVLKWDQEGFEALQHSLEAAEALGVLGRWVSDFLAIGERVLIRLSALHLTLVPGLIAGLLAAHFLLVKRHGISPIPWGSPEHVQERYDAEKRIEYTSHLARLAMWALAIGGLTLLLAGLFPPRLGPEAVPGIEVTKPPWYFLWIYPLENALGLSALLIAPVVAALLLVLVPFVDRGPERDPRRRWWVFLLLALLVGGWLALTIYAALTGLAEHLE